MGFLPDVILYIFDSISLDFLHYIHFKFFVFSAVSFSYYNFLPFYTSYFIAIFTTAFVLVSSIFFIDPFMVIGLKNF